jgi:sRNA-binding regulator protein Hfq
MDKPAQNIQDSFLNNARKDKIVLTIYLMAAQSSSAGVPQASAPAAADHSEG